ncbi:hypothetical protein LTR62_000930 [Meristemomyces frigidus]|uniref:Uncharacterized protein n=1 Tax=Meristemomyces frigidus TaxID=1508187 RepID=A0AAN7T9T7_9PEZI|nr:hypothetical protein LTR62_000930 [Meristemomyces frigidus]
MNIGNLPGYYWDGEKKKYFKIQANHVAPIDAKYTNANAKREEQAIKKRKIDEKRKKKKLLQTVRKPRILEDHLIAVTGLDREHGTHDDRASMLSSREAVFVGGLTPTSQQWPATVYDYLPDVYDGLVALGNGGDCCNIYSRVSANTQQATETGHKIAAFNSDLVSIDALLPNRVVAVARTATSRGNIYIGQLDDWGQGSVYFASGSQEDSSVWATTLHPDQSSIVLGSTNGLLHVDLNSQKYLAQQHHDMESRSVAWLDSNVIAYGRKSVRLWDIRSSGSTKRFARDHDIPITGIFTPNDHGVQLLVSDNRRIEMRDTRMGSKGSVWTWQQTHEGPQLQAAVHKELQLFVAVSQYNEPWVYSLRSGKYLGALGTAGIRSGELRRLRWLEGDGAVLQACQANSVLTWS